MADNGVLTIPSSYFTDAIVNHAKLQLIVDELTQPYIIFLPVEESEPFPIENTLIRDNGILRTSEDLNVYLCTELIDITFVEEFVYKGYQSRSNTSAVYGYDENGNPVIQLSSNSNRKQIIHLVPDGTYKYIRACANLGESYSLELHFRSRRPRTTDNNDDDSR